MAPEQAVEAPDALDAAADELLTEMTEKPGADQGAEGGEPKPEEGAAPKPEPGKEKTQPKEKPAEGAAPKAGAEKKPPAQEAEPEAGKPVPYDRFKSTLERAKGAEGELGNLKTQHTELQAKHDRSMGNFRTLATRLSKYPAIEMAVEAMVKTEDGKIPEDALAAIVAELTKGVDKPEGGDKKDPKDAPADAVTRQLNELRARLDTKENQENEARATEEASRAFTLEAKELKDPKSKVRETLEKKFPGLEVDKHFLEQVWDQGEREAKVAELEGGPRPSLHAIAERLAAPLFGYRQRLLENKAEGLKPRKGAGLERTGGPVGKAREKEPPFASREWNEWAQRNSDLLTTAPEDEA